MSIPITNRLVPILVDGDTRLHKALPDRIRVDLTCAKNLRDKLNAAIIRSGASAAYNETADDFTIYRVYDVLNNRRAYLIAQKGFASTGEVTA